MLNMKNLLLLLCFVSSASLAQTARYWVASGAGNWSDPNNWATTSTGSGPATVPNSTSYSAYFDGAVGNGNCTVDIPVTIAGLYVTGYSGTVTFSNDVTSTGINFVTSGLLTTPSSNKLILNTNSTTTTFGNSVTPNGVTIDVEIAYTGSGSGSVLFNGAIFKKPVSVKKTSTVADNGWGGNTFKQAVILENNATAGSFGFASTNPNTFEGDLTITSSASGSSTNVANNTAGTVFKGNVYVNYSYSGAGAPGAITFGNNGGTSSFVGTGAMTLSCTGTQGCGDLTIAGLTYSGGNAHTFDLTQNGSTTATLTLGPSSSSNNNRSSFNGNLTAKAPKLLLNGVTCIGSSNTISLEKTASTTDTGLGNNSFDGSVTITNSSGTSLQTNGGNNFYGTVLMQNTGVGAAGTISLERVSGSTYWGASTFSNSGGNGSYIQVGYAGTTSMKDNITVNSTGVAGSFGIYFGDEIGGGGVSLADGKTIKNGMSSGVSTFNTGELRLVKFSQNDGTTAQTITLTTTATTAGGLRIGPNSNFAGDVAFSAPSVWLDGCTYGGPNNTSIITKTGSSSDNGRGGNVFNKDIILQNTGSGVFATAATAGGSADTFTGKLTVNPTSTGTIRLSDKVDGTQFNGDLVLNSEGTGGISTGSNGGTFVGGGKSTLADGKSIMTSSTSGSGTTQLAFFSQGTTAPSTTQTVTFTGSAILALGPNSTFYGDVSFSSPGILLKGATYKGVATLIKTGSSADPGDGGNTFEKVATLSNSGSGEFRTGNSTKDIFKDDLTTINSGSGSISLAYNNSSATEFQKNVYFNSTYSMAASTTSGVYIGTNGNAGATLASGSMLLVGSNGGVTNGKILLATLSQPVGVTTNQSMTFTQNANNALLHIANSYFRGDVSFTSPRILLNGNTFDGTNTFTKTGTNAGDDLTGGNNFTGGASGTKSTTLATANTVTGYWAFSYPGPADTFSGPLVINKGGSGNINLAHNVSSGTTTFNNTVSFNSTATSGFITIGIVGGNGAVVNGTNTLCMNCGASGGTAVANGATVTLGKVDVMNDQTIFSNSTNSPTTFTGQLNIGYTSTSLACRFRGNLTVKQRQVVVQYSTFDGNVTIEKTGSLADASDASAGGNTFGNASGDVIKITNSGSGVFRLANTTGDTYYGTTTFEQSAGTIQPAYKGTNKFYSDLSTNASNSTAITFGANTGDVTFSGGSTQTISKTTTPSVTTSPIFKTMVMSQSSGGSVRLSTDISISGSLTFNSGIIYSNSPASTNIVNFVSGTTATAVAGTPSNTSHIDGIVQKTGDKAFVFPTGKNGIYRSIGMSAPSNTTDVFTAEFFRSDPNTDFGTLTTTCTIGSCEYWLLNRGSSTTSTVFVTLSWNSNDCSGYNITNPANLVVAQWNSVWVNLGNNSTVSSSPFTQGTVLSSAMSTSYGAFTLGGINGLALPIELTSFEVRKQNNTAILEWKTASELNNYGFEIYKSIDGKEFYKIGFVTGNGTTNLSIDYTFNDPNLLSRAYYKLRQLDYDGHSVYSEIRSLIGDGDRTKMLTVYPNPVDKTAQIVLQGVNDQESVEIKILDGGGQIIKSYHGTVSEINELLNANIANFAAGLYIINAAMSSGNLHYKFIKI